MWTQAFQRRLGRPYNAILGAGLVAEIARHVRELVEKAGSAPGVLRELVVIAFGVALLLHQLGELAHRFERHGSEGGGDRGGHEAEI